MSRHGWINVNPHAFNRRAGPGIAREAGGGGVRGRRDRARSLGGSPNAAAESGRPGGRGLYT